MLSLKFSFQEYFNIEIFMNVKTYNYFFGKTKHNYQNILYTYMCCELLKFMPTSIQIYKKYIINNYCRISEKKMRTGHFKICKFFVILK